MNVTQRINQELWNVHHAISVNSPKLGELVVVNKSHLDEVKMNIGCDEVLLEEAITRNRHLLKYYSNATVFNFSPKRYSELFSYVRRVRAQHILVHNYNGYSTSSYSIVKNLRCIVSGIRKREIKIIGFIGLALTIIPAFSLAKIDTLAGRNYLNWNRSESTRSKNSGLI